VYYLLMRELLQITELALQSITSPDRWDDVANAIVKHFGLVSVAIFRSPVCCAPVPNFTVSDHLKGDNCQPLVEHFSQGGDESDLIVYKKFLAVPPLQLVSERAFVCSSRYQDMPACTERDLMLKYAGVRCRLAASLNASGPWRDIIALHERRRTQDINKKTYEQMNLLLPTFSYAMAASREFEHIYRNMKASASALDSVDFGVAILDGKGRAIYLNSYFETLVQSNDGISYLADGTVSCRIDQSLTLTELLAPASAHCLPSADLNSGFCISRKSMRRPYLLRIHAAQNFLGSLTPAKSAYILFALDPEMKKYLSVKELPDFNTLTQAEAEVCGYLLEDLDTVEIAERRNVSIHTVRCQIKIVLHKLRCRSRAQLCHLAFSMHLPSRTEWS
jgi:DNA-binding CsgD family transcriptional regulator